MVEHTGSYQAQALTLPASDELQARTMQELAERGTADVYKLAEAVGSDHHLVETLLRLQQAQDDLLVQTYSPDSPEQYVVVGPVSKGFRYEPTDYEMAVRPLPCAPPWLPEAGDVSASSRGTGSVRGRGNIDPIR